jgi:5-oxoprolinase (ATP-hydrolysing)
LRAMYRVGIDTGGTFTDLIALDPLSGEIRVEKQPSTPAKPELAVQESMRRSGVLSEEIEHVVLGTTIGTNALLERRGARVIYLTTEGFTDIPYIQRVDKKDPYDLQWCKPQPFVCRSDCLGVRERVCAQGRVLTPLTGQELERLTELIKRRISAGGNDVALAINLLFSYADPAHERLLHDFLREALPGVPLSISSEISPIWREYERASTTIIDAYLKPLMMGFLDELLQRLRGSRYRGPLLVMKSNGGRMAASAARDQPVHTMLSGLSGGVIAGRYFAQRMGFRDIITLDMGGTSTDVATVTGGEVDNTTEYEVDFSIPVLAPFLDMKTIGAGGGSIAWIDPGGLLRVGPGSAGAEPGPVCYGLGGKDVTVTDANLVLGRLNPDNFLGGRIRLMTERARKRVRLLGEQLGMSVEQTALAVIDLANENMANAIRVLTIERGLDPRNYALVAFGGAGPLHGSDLAANLSLQELIVPPHPGLASAFGTLVADPRVDRRWTRYYTSDRIDLDEVNIQMDRLVRESTEELRQEGYAGKALLARSISMRYAGQNYEREITVSGGTITHASFKRVLEAFHREHHEFYGFSFPEEVVELIHFNVTARGEGLNPSMPELAPGRPPDPATRRPVYFRAKGFLRCPVYRRDTLPAGAAIRGPAVIEEMDSTTLVHPDQSLTVSREGILSLKWEKDQAAAVTGRSGRGIDGVSLVILHNSLVNITREMGMAMMHTAYSPIFSESRDFACALFDSRGRMIAQGEFCPAQLGAMPLTVRWIISELGLESFEPGDVIIHNDPYRGGCHMPEHLMLKPVFSGERLVAFAGAIGHVAEIGAAAVGSFASDATEVFQEGLRLPPVKLMSRGQYVQDVWKIIMANHRTPRNTWGDFHAMLGALNIAERRLKHQIDHYGMDFFRAATAQLLDYAERLMRREIAAVPDGEYAFEERMEDDGISDQPFHIRVNVAVNGEEILVDFTGSDPQAAGPINATYGVTTSATYNALLQLTGSHIPRNAGCYRPVTIIAPAGSIVNVAYPGPSVGGNTETQPRIVGAILGAMGQVLPERVMASEGATSCNFLFGGVHPLTGRYYVHYHFEASGWGGRWSSDGNSVQNHIHGNCRNTPVEIFETLYPFRVIEYALRPDSGGAGRNRGGLASRRVLEVLAPEITVSLMMDHVREGAWGALGGLPGGLAGVRIRRKGAKKFIDFCEAFGTVSPSKFADVTVREGDRIMVDSAGGGGYGKPSERDTERILADVEQGFVSREAAQKIYGLRRAGEERIGIEAALRDLQEEGLEQ